jgi:hypothetical protein
MLGWSIEAKQIAAILHAPLAAMRTNPSLCESEHAVPIAADAAELRLQQLQTRHEQLRGAWRQRADLEPIRRRAHGATDDLPRFLHRDEVDGTVKRMIVGRQHQRDR